jgi:deoxyinosine 3'endonuclease (endonuclease V)
MNIKDCLSSWEREQCDLIDKINLTDRYQISEIKYIGGADISWDKNNIDAVACMVIHEYPSLKLVGQFTVKCQVHIPYQPGFLAFREVPVYLKLTDAIHQNYPELLPQMILIDGNGVWHPRGLGAASHFSILSGIPAIGVSKNVLFADGMGRDEVLELVEMYADKKDETVEVIGQSLKLLGYAYNSSGSAKKAIYISAGNMVSQPTALEIVKSVNKYRVSETIRQADKLSRMLLAE